MNSRHSHDDASSGRAAGRGLRDELRSALQGVASAEPMRKAGKAPAPPVAGWGHQKSPSFGDRRDRAESQDMAQWIVDPRTRRQLISAIEEYQSTGDSRQLGDRLGAFEPAQAARATSAPALDVESQGPLAQDGEYYRARLSAIEAELARVEERERQRLSMDVQDGLTQTIHLIKLKLAALRRAPASSLSTSVLELERLIDRADQGARSISFDLDPPSLHHLGLAPAVLELASRIEARYGVSVRIEDDGRPKHIDEQARVVLYRSILELFVNAAKHARARRICARLERGDRTINVTIEDDGMSMRASAASAGFGFSTIRERLGHAGGSMHIESVPEHGTKICLCAPLATDRTMNTRALQ